MNFSISPHPYLRRVVLHQALLLAMLFALFQAGNVLALSLSTSAVTMHAGSTATVSVTNTSGTVRATSSATAIATASYASGRATITGVAPGTATVRISDNRDTDPVSVTVMPALGVSPGTVSLQVGATSTVSVTNAIGTVSAVSSAPTIASVTFASGVATIKGVKTGSATITIADSGSSKQVAVSVVSSVPVSGGYSLLAWNDLGMHCVDGVDYSIFNVLPPFNVLNAQLVNKSTGKLVTTGVTLTYQSVADATGSINTSSASKTNFWRYALALFGMNPAPNVGLLGYPTPSNAAAPMAYNAANNWFEAVGIPITPYDDAMRTNFYPMVQVTAKSSTGQVLATTKVVLPVSDELTCKGCHSSTNSTNPALTAAKPTAGWVFDSNTITDWKKNILRLHDEKQAGKPAYVSSLVAKGYSAGLYPSAINGKPIFCAACHVSNAYGVEAGLPTGVSGISPFTQAMHANHAGVVDPASGLKLDNINNRSACYLCHPGSVTQCLRGAMANVKDASGAVALGCQNCHGNMAKVGAVGRAGWLAEPNCQSCHHDSKREISAVNASGDLLTWTDTHFATNPNKPLAGISLYRFSTGHGNLQCSACHGATHAEYPSTEANDNVQSIALQGHAGTVHECTACHGAVPTTTNGGPHGMHTIGSRWVSGHEDASDSSTKRASCAYCHGADFRGSFLSQVKVAKTFNKKDSGTINYTAGQKVSCYDCHSGPSGGGLDKGTRFAVNDKDGSGKSSRIALDFLADLGGKFLEVLRGTPGSMAVSR